METFVVFFYPPLLAIAVDCRRQWTAMWTAMDGNGRQWTAMDSNGRQWSTMDGNGYAGSGEQSYFSDMICSENPGPVFSEVFEAPQARCSGAQSSENPGPVFF